MNIKYKQQGNKGFFDKDFASEKLSKIGNPLEKLHKVIDFEMFRPELEEALLNHDKKSNAGARPLDVVMMFKIILIKRFYNLSDQQTEYQIIDRLSFKEFLGLSSGDKVPDEKSIWLFQDNLIKANLEEKLFEQFHNYLDTMGLFVNEGKIIDASFVEVPRQRNTPEENEKIKAGEGDELWNDNPHKKCQKDIDARWTKKGGERFYGYKDHVKIDNGHKLIDTYEVTSAEVHDSQPVEKLLREKDKGKKVFGDSAYGGETLEKVYEKFGVEAVICERAYRNRPLTDEQKANNRITSKTRSRVEHIFGFVTQSMHDFFSRNIGFNRIKGVIGLINLFYNMLRYEQIVRRQLQPVSVK
jgi:IS5 family transposase